MNCNCFYIFFYIVYFCYFNSTGFVKSFVIVQKNPRIVPSIPLLQSSIHRYDDHDDGSTTRNHNVMSPTNETNVLLLDEEEEEGKKQRSTDNIRPSSTSVPVRTGRTTFMSSTGNHETPVEKLCQKLRSYGIMFALVPESDDEDEPNEHDNNNNDSIERDGTSSSKTKTAQSCKTLIWEATFMESTTSSNTSTPSRMEKLYFATLLKLNERIDENLLKQHVSKMKQQQQRRRRYGTTGNTKNPYHSNNNDDDDDDDDDDDNNGSEIIHRVKQIKLADKTVAESLTGYVSGAIPPFGHKIPLTLFIDEKLSMIEKEGKEEEEDVDVLRIGSGCIGYDMRIIKSELLKYCSATTKVFICPISKGISNEKKTSSSINKKHQHHHQHMVGGTALTDQSKQIQSVTVELTKKQQEQHQQQHVQEQKNLNNWWMKPLAKRLRDVGTKEKLLDRVRPCLDEAGSTLHELMYGGINGDYTKTPVHNAAWRGCKEALTMFVKAGKDLGHDYINLIAIGDCNYGNTPIFYALSRSREEMVYHCLDLGASLLVVNNKGQTPCSLAVAHFNGTIVEDMIRIEEEQLRAGGTFVNYRLSHSDGRRYDDLDPRFPIDDDNMDGKLREELSYFKDIESKKLRYVNDIPVGTDFTRGIRQTTVEIRNSKAFQRRMQRTQFRRLIPRLNLTHQQTTDEQKRNHHNHNDVEVEVDIDVTTLETLSIEDVLEQPASIVVVSTLEDIEMFASVVEEAIANKQSIHGGNSNSNGSNNSNSSLFYQAWGLDTEWQPGINHPVATLQLSSSKQSFVIDLLSICQQRRQQVQVEENEEEEEAHQYVTKTTKINDIVSLTKEEKLLSSILTKLFLDDDIPIVGFGITSDLYKMAYSYPHMECFFRYHSIIDYQAMARICNISNNINNKMGNTNSSSRNRKGGGRGDHYHHIPFRVNSLQKAVGVLLKKHLIKDEQCSNWSDRPLTTSQINYAAIDAAAPRILLLETFRRYNNNDDHDDDIENNNNGGGTYTEVTNSGTTLSTSTTDPKRQNIISEIEFLKQFPQLCKSMKLTRLDQMKEDDNGQDTLNTVNNNNNHDDDDNENKNNNDNDNDGNHKQSKYSRYYHIEMGNEKTSMGVRLAKQVWMSTREEPPDPILIDTSTKQQQQQQMMMMSTTTTTTDLTIDEDHNGKNVNGATTTTTNNSKKQKAAEKKRINARMRKGMKQIPLKNLPADITSLPKPGTMLGYTKDDCVNSILGTDIVNSIAMTNFRLRFNRRGGIVEMDNAWLLFINFTGHTKGWSYRNEFSNDNKSISFAVNAMHLFKENDLPFLFELGCLDDNDSLELEYIEPMVQRRHHHHRHDQSGHRTILLFTRLDNSSKFIFCGRCSCYDWTGGPGTYHVLLNLLDYDTLIEPITVNDEEGNEEEGSGNGNGKISSSSSSSHYLEMVRQLKLQEEEAAAAAGAAAATVQQQHQQHHQV